MSSVSKNLIFDLDGTLIDSSKGILSSYKKTFKKSGLIPKIELRKEIIGSPLVETISKLSGIKNQEELSALKRTFQNIYDIEGVQLTKPFPGISKMLKRLFKERFSMYIATNKREIPTKKILDHLHWNQYFNEVYCIDSFDSPFKSKDKILEKLIKRHDIKEKTYYIGDTEEDLSASKICGLSFILVQWGYGVLNLNNNLSISSPSQLASYVMKE